jgi:hypothetical protein
MYISAASDGPVSVCRPRAEWYGVQNASACIRSSSSSDVLTLAVVSPMKGLEYSVGARLKERTGQL